MPPTKRVFGVRVDSSLWEHARSCKRIGQEAAVRLALLAGDGHGVTPTERDTFDLILRKLPVTRLGKSVLRVAMRGR